MTDYEGLGTPGEHTYTAGRAQAHAALDIVRAAQRLPAAGLSNQAPVGIAGYSQGGQAAGWAAEIASGYAPELEIKAFAVGAAPADLPRVAEFNNGGPHFGLVMAAGVGLEAAYPELDLKPFLNEAGLAAFESIRDKCAGQFGDYANHSMGELTDRDPFADPAWSERLAEQTLGGQAPSAPTLLYHSVGDEVIPVDVGDELSSRWCGNGADLTYWRVRTGGHGQTSAVLSSAVARWVAGRLAGNPTAGNC